jgi:glycosyltransferase involved in cell wall biosynthesis
MRKGFDIYQYLDKNLNFDRFEFTFVGNSPMEYDNVNWIDPVPSKELADYLKQHHIYITASRNDPCSNALIEALHCGLPAVARDDGGHPEIIGGAGELFTNKSGVIPTIETVAENLDHYRDRINIPTMAEVSDQYYTFLDRVATAVDSESFKPKTLNPATRQRYRLRLRYQFLKRRVQNIIFD